ncbi:MAG: acyltransferase [Gammaproteobacteria bacterium]|nr:acyltransferase [Gammaproteobacteria bacterium]MDH5594272.1 acyltransferase [Gammaproteobacteria bacterium]MDH5613578.1 acyltransferase [Gammaproteobacteria bacterium]
MEDISHLQLGKSKSEIRFDTLDDNRRIVHLLISQARTTIDIFTRDFEPGVYDSTEFTACLKTLSLNNKRSKIRILIQEPSRCIREGHQVLNLAQKLTSYIEIRKPGYEHSQINEAFLVADNTGYVHKQYADRFEGTTNFNNPSTSDEKTRLFNEVWEMAEIDPNLRRLYL